MAWIFRSSEPVGEQLRSVRSDEWPVEQHQALISPGDLVFFWEGGSEGRVVGVGRIQTPVYRSQKDARKLRARVGHNVVLREPLTADECRCDELLGDLTILRRGDQTNYGLSRALADRVLSLLAARQAGLAESLNLRPESIPPLREREGQPSSAKPAESASSESRRGEAFARHVAEQVAAFRADPANDLLHALRMAAYERMRGLLAPEVLAEVTAERFAREFGEFGSVVVDGEALTLAGAVKRLQAAPLREMIRAGRIRTEGNLTAEPASPILEQGTDRQKRNALSLRLRAGLAHLVSENLTLENRVNRMRRSFDALWPEIATIVLAALRPDEHVAYHRLAVDGLARLGMDFPRRPTLDDYVRYVQFVAAFRESRGLASPAQVELFLVRTVRPEWPAGGGFGMERGMGEEIRRDAGIPARSSQSAERACLGAAPSRSKEKP